MMLAQRLKLQHLVSRATENEKAGMLGPVLIRPMEDGGDIDVPECDSGLIGPTMRSPRIRRLQRHGKSKLLLR
jgi:hypothetical protein